MVEQGGWRLDQVAQVTWHGEGAASDLRLNRLVLGGGEGQAAANEDLGQIRQLELAPSVRRGGGRNEVRMRVDGRAQIRAQIARRRDDFEGRRG